MSEFALRDPLSRYCTGAHDWIRDGAMDEVGWVADLVNSGNAIPADMLCPSNPGKASEKVNDLLGSESSEGNYGNNFILAGRYTPILDTITPGSTARAAFVGSAFIDRGYNTNYAAGYHLVRGMPKTSSSGAGTYVADSHTYINGVQGVPPNSFPNRFREVGGTSGPLQSNMIDSGRLAASTIGILGDAGPGDIDEAILQQTIPSAKVTLPTGMLLTEAFNDGPHQYDIPQQRLRRLQQGANLADQVACERGEATMVPCASILNAFTGAGNGGIFLQDTRDWFAVHNGILNLLMADGSVKSIVDLNGDGYLNPGFPINNAVTDIDILNLGYANGQVELTPDQFFGGVFLTDQYFKGRFE
jgi:hypothetical protein